MGRGFEVEHIWADHPERHADEFSHEPYLRRDIATGSAASFSFRGAVQCLSHGDLTYKKKLPHYDSQNLLARSLHEKCYEHNPGFVRFVE